MPLTAFTVESLNEAVRLYKLGFSVDDVARMLVPPVHPRSLIYHLRRRGVLRDRMTAIRSERCRQLKSISRRGRYAGADSPNWKGDAAQPQAGRVRAHDLYPRAPRVCSGCGKSPQKRMDRHHVDGNPLNNAPDNVQWLCTKCHRSRHPKDKIISFNGLSLTYAQWAERIGITKKGLLSRLWRGWSIELALSLPPKSKYQY